MGEIPGYVSIVFIITTFAAVAFLLQGVKAAGLESSSTRTFICAAAVDHLPVRPLSRRLLSRDGGDAATIGRIRRFSGFDIPKLFGCGLPKWLDPANASELANPDARRSDSR